MSHFLLTANPGPLNSTANPSPPTSQLSPSASIMSTSPPESLLGFPSRSFIFEVVDKPPLLQMGIGELDGKLYAQVDRPMPRSQLGDKSRWSSDLLTSDKDQIEAKQDKHTVAMDVDKPLYMDDPAWLDDKSKSPKLTFHSSLGDTTASLLGDFHADENGKRFGQTGNCNGDLYYPR